MKRDNVTPDELTFAIKWLIHFSDGSNSLQDISKISKINISYLKKGYLILKKKNFTLVYFFLYKLSL